MYSFNLPTIGGIDTGAYTFLSLFNPSGSGKVITLHQIQTAPYSAGTSTSVATLLLNRITAASGGTLQAASAINKLQTLHPDPVAEVRTGDPTVTTGAVVTRFAPPIQSLTVTSFAPAMQEINFLSDQWGNFTLVEGEGVAFRQAAAGDTDQRWPFLIVWGE